MANRFKKVLPKIISENSKTLKISPTDPLFDTVKVVSSAC
jgi:hypothetical protein